MRIAQFVQVQLGILVINALAVLDLSFRWTACITSAIAVLNIFFIAIAPETPRLDICVLICYYVEFAYLYLITMYYLVLKPVNPTSC